MKKEKILELVKLYHTELARVGAVARKMDENKDPSTLTALDFRNHLAWACDYTQELVERHEALDVAQQWIGFLQGAFWVLADYTIEEMRQHCVEGPTQEPYNVRSRWHERE